MFRLTEIEINNLRSKFSTANFKTKSRSLPYCFTEQGVYMLSTVLRGELAEQQSIFIMRAFREMRHYIMRNRQFVTVDDLRLITKRQDETDGHIKNIRESIDKINEKFISETEFRNFVIYKGQKFEADKAYIDIYRKADKSIFVIDNYVNIKTLELLSQKKQNVSVIIFTENKHGRNGFLTAAEIDDFNSEYPALTIKPNHNCHDRFIVLDYGLTSEKLYHCGASSKDAGNKVCAINAIDNTELIHPVIDELLGLTEKVI